MIRVDDREYYDQAAPIEKLLTLVLAFFGRDNASELRFDHRSSADEVRLWYCVRDELFEMVPPPPEMWPDLVRLLLHETRPAAGQERARLRGLFRKPAFPDFPFSGTLTVRYGCKECNFDILFFRGRTGEHIWIEKASKDDLSPTATDFFNEWRARHKPNK